MYSFQHNGHFKYIVCENNDVIKVAIMGLKEQRKPDFRFHFFFYLPPHTPHGGPLEPVTCNKAALFVCIYVH